METQSPNKQTWGSAAFKISRANNYRTRFSSMFPLKFSQSSESKVTCQTQTTSSDKTTELLNNPWFLLMLILVILIYLLTGAFLFQSMEDSKDKKLQSDVLDIKAQLMADFKALSMSFTEGMKKVDDRQSMSNLHEQFDKKANILTDMFLFNITKIISVYGWNGRLLVRNWNFARSLRFCFSVITTIGYGDITANTTCGRIFTLVYAVFGIPLIMLFSEIMGIAMTNLLNKSYHKGNHILNKITGAIKRVLLESTSSDLSLPSIQIRSRSLSQIRPSTVSTNIEDEETNGIDDTIDVKKTNSQMQSDANVLESSTNVDPIENFPVLTKPKVSIGSSEIIPVSPNSLPMSTAHTSREDMQSRVINFNKLDDIRRRCPVQTSDKASAAPGWWYMSAVVIYTCVGASVFLIWDNVSFQSGLYATFTTLTTIGFGDLVFGESEFHHCIEHVELLHMSKGEELKYLQNSFKLFPFPSNLENIKQAWVIIHLIYIFLGLPFLPILIQRIGNFLETFLNTETQFLVEYNPKK